MNLKTIAALVSSMKYNPLKSSLNIYNTSMDCWTVKQKAAQGNGLVQQMVELQGCTSYQGGR